MECKCDDTGLCGYHSARLREAIEYRAETGMTPSWPGARKPGTEHFTEFAAEMSLADEAEAWRVAQLAAPLYAAFGRDASYTYDVAVREARDILAAARRQCGAPAREPHTPRRSVA